MNKNKYSDSKLKKRKLLEMSVVPESIRDSTTIYDNHTMNSYLPCVILRITIGMCLILFATTIMGFREIVVLLALLFSFGFASKWLGTPGQNSWKVFIRTTIAYLCVAILVYLSNSGKDEPEPSLIRIAGVLIIVDALMGLQSRHTVQVIRRITGV